MSSMTSIATHSGVPPIQPKAFVEKQPDTLRLFPLSNYTFSTKETQHEEDPSVGARLKRLEEHYEKHGMRRTCEAVLVCHDHNHPHIIMLQIANSFFKLPGDYLKPEDEEIEGFRQRLDARLAPAPASDGSGPVSEPWNIGDVLAQWWRPNFETFMYPFLPAHITRPKESKKLYLLNLPERRELSVPKNMKILAVPLFELYENTTKYGPQLAAIPHMLSRYKIEFVDEKGNINATTPGIEPSSLPVRVMAEASTKSNGMPQQVITTETTTEEAATNGDQVMT